MKKNDDLKLILHIDEKSAENNIDEYKKSWDEVIDFILSEFRHYIKSQR